PGLSLETRWIALHDTRADGTAPFDASALAKARGATPFKRPENGMFRPDGHFREFFFTETGDTNADTQAGSEFGGFGAIQRLTQTRPEKSAGRLTTFYRGDLAHTAFDNLAFLTRDRLLVCEDRDDFLHAQANALDSLWMFAVVDEHLHTPEPARLLAEGRDPSATIDAELADSVGTQNDGDNEITGLHVSDGDASRDGLLGTR